jgi:hypothetical protein
MSSLEEKTKKTKKGKCRPETQQIATKIKRGPSRRQPIQASTPLSLSKKKGSNQPV